MLTSRARNVGARARDIVVASYAGSKRSSLDRILLQDPESLAGVVIIENGPSWTPELRSRDRVNTNGVR